VSLVGFGTHRDVTKYRIRVCVQQHSQDTTDAKTKEFIVRRRFSEFYALYIRLASVRPEKFKQVKHSIPSRFYSTSPLERRPRLERFLQNVCEVFSPCGSSKKIVPVELVEFLKLGKLDFGKMDDKLEIDYGSASVPAMYKDEIEKVCEEVLELSKLGMNEGGFHKLGVKHGITYGARTEGGYRKLEGIIENCTPLMIHDIIMDSENIKKMEPNIKTIERIETLDEQNCVEYILMHSIMFMACRDCCMYHHYRVLSDGGILHIQFSIDHEKVVSPTNTVRAVLSCGGYIVRALPNDPTAVHISVINNMDPMLGDIPASVKSQVNDFTAGMLLNNIKIIKTKLLKQYDLNEYLMKKPLVNLNGKVTGVVSQVSKVVPRKKSEENKDTSMERNEWSFSSVLSTLMLVISWAIWFSLFTNRTNEQPSTECVGSACPKSL